MNDLLVFSPSPEMGFLHPPPSFLDLPHLFVEYFLSFLADRLAYFFIVFPTEAGFVHGIGRVGAPRTHCDDVQLRVGTVDYVHGCTATYNLGR
jgi:hypothetical protein